MTVKQLRDTLIEGEFEDDEEIYIEYPSHLDSHFKLAVPIRDLHEVAIKQAIYPDKFEVTNEESQTATYILALSS